MESLVTRERGPLRSVMGSVVRTGSGQQAALQAFENTLAVEAGHFGASIHREEAKSRLWMAEWRDRSEGGERSADGDEDRVAAAEQLQTADEILAATRQAGHPTLEITHLGGVPVRVVR